MKGTSVQTFVASAMLGLMILGAGSASAAWNVQHVGSTNIDTGDNCSVAVDALGRPHVAFAAKWKTDLYYACKTGATWTVQVLKTNCYPLNRAAINIDTNGRPHICFAGSIGGTAAVYHAYSQSGASWTYEKIQNANSGGGLDSAFDSSGKLHVSYFNGSDGTLRYAVKSGASWSVSIFTNMGSASSIAVDSLGNPHISFIPQWPAGMCYASKTSATWSVVTIDTNLAMNGNTSIAVDLLGRPHMSWLDWQLAAARVRYAYWNGTSWQKEYVEGAVEQFNDLEVKPDGTPVISYFYKTATNAPYRLYVAEKSGGVWQKQVIEQNSATNDLDVIQLGIVLDTSISPHLAYCNNWGMGAIHNLKYATSPSGRPFAPTNIAASDGAYGDHIHVTWSASSGATGYEVWRHATNSPGYATKIAPNVAGTSFDDSTVTPNVAYIYWLKAINASGASAFSLSDSGYASNAPPSAPTGVSATDGTYPNKVQVSWSASSGATGYQVWRHTSNNSNSANRIDSGVGGVSYDDNTVIVGTSYYYWIKATNAGGTSVFSNVDSGYAQAFSLAINPTSTNFTSAASTGRTIGVTANGAWNAASNVSWIAITGGAAGTSNGTITFSVATNSSSSRTGGVIVAGGGLTRTCTVTQAGAAFSSCGIAGAISYGGSQAGLVQVVASPNFGIQSNIALSLDGVDDGVVVQAPTDLLQLGTQMTMCAWINVTGQLAGTFATMLIKYETSTNRVAYLFGLNSNDGKPYATFGDGHNFSALQGVGVTSGWTHLAFTHDGITGTWYINGQFSSELNSGSIGRRGGGQFYIGRYVDLQTYFNRFPGQLDDIGLWSRTLTQGEIQGVMSDGLSGIEAGIAGCWNFDDGTANDLTTNANNGQFMAGATTTVHSATASPYSTNLASPGGYSISNVPAGEYTVWAYRDSSGNGSHDSWEANGSYAANPLVVTGAMRNIDIALQDPVTDSDGDGLSDYDEIYVYHSSWSNRDSDADGMPDGDEVLAGSSPTNGDSIFGFADALPVLEGGGVVVSWPSLSNRVYRLERTTNLLLDFEPLVNDLPADPPVNSYTDDTPNVLGVYKVGVRME